MQIIIEVFETTQELRVGDGHPGQPSCHLPPHGAAEYGRMRCTCGRC